MGKFVDNLGPGLTENSDPSEYEAAYWKSEYKMPLD